MLTYQEWKKLKDWVIWILDKGSFLLEGAIELGLAEFGILPPASSVISWLVTKAIKWGVGWLLDLIPHEAENGITYYKGNMHEFRKLGDEPPTVSEIKKTANVIPLVPLRPAKIPAANNGSAKIPFAALENPGFATPDETYPDPTEYDKQEIKRTDRMVQRGASMVLQKTAPWITTGNPVPGAPIRGFTNPADAFTRNLRIHS